MNQDLLTTITQIVTKALVDIALLVIPILTAYAANALRKFAADRQVHRVLTMHELLAQVARQAVFAVEQVLADTPGPAKEAGRPLPRHRRTRWPRRPDHDRDARRPRRRDRGPGAALPSHRRAWVGCGRGPGERGNEQATGLVGAGTWIAHFGASAGGSR